MIRKLFPISGQRGFTLLEVLIVVAILGLLAGAAIPNLASMTTMSRVNAANAELDNVRTAETAYYATTQTWPHDSTQLTDLIGTPKATYIFDSANGFVVGVTAVSWQGVRWAAPAGPPYEASGKWIRQ